MRFVFNQFVLDCEQGVLWREGDLVPLPPKVLETLSLLVKAGGRVVTKQEFMDSLWPNSFVEDGNLTQNIFVLRKALGDSADGRPYIETVPKRGYRFVAAAVQQEAPQASEAEAVQTVDVPQPSEASEPASPPELTAGRASRRRTAGLSLLMLGALLAGGYRALHSTAGMQIGKYQRLTHDGLPKALRSRFTHAAIMQDRDQLYFNEAKGNAMVLARVASTGGETAYESAPSPDSQAVGLSPRGAALLFGGSTWKAEQLPPLISKDLRTGVFSPVFNLHAQDASWSPDGKRLVYAQFGKLLLRAEDGSTRLLASVNGLVYWPRWSPDGRVLRFTQNYDGYHDRLWEVEISGANLHQLFPEQAGSDSMCCGSWTESGRAFVYMTDMYHSSSIHVRPESGGGLWSWLRGSPPPIEVPAAPLDNWDAAVPGVDGNHIYAVGEQLRGRLMRINPATRKPEPYLDGISAEGVSFSPDRASMVWTAYPEGTLWRSRLDGGERVQLTESSLVARFPHWSPDGSTIVFIAARPGSDWKLYTVPAQGGAVKPLLQQSTTGQGVATWSADGKAVAFGDLINAGETHRLPSAIEIYRLGDAKATTLPGSLGLWTARWSPDGRFVSALTRDNQTLRLYDMQRGIWTDVAHGNINDVVWTPDSKYLFFDTAFGVEPVLYRLQLSDQKLEVWAKLDNVRRAGFFGPWLGTAPDGAPILLEDASIQELYSISVNLP